MACIHHVLCSGPTQSVCQLVTLQLAVTASTQSGTLIKRNYWCELLRSHIFVGSQISIHMLLVS